MAKDDSSSNRERWGPAFVHPSLRSQEGQAPRQPGPSPQGPVIEGRPDLMSWRPAPQPAPLLLPDQPGRVPWTGRDVAAIVGIMIAGFFIVTVAALIAVSLLSAATGLDRQSIVSSPGLTTAILVFQWVVVFGGTIALFKARGYRFSIKTMGWRWPPSKLEAVLLAIGLLIPAYVAISVYSSFIQPSPQDITGEFSPSLLGFIIAFIEVALLVPMIEETFFRGIIHQGLEQKLGFIPGALISAAIFATAHLSATIFIPIFILGFIFAWLMHHTHSVMPSIIAHMTFNAIAVIGQYFVQPPG